MAGNPDPNFGQRMTEARRASGNLGGRPKIADKYRGLIGKAESVFARALPDEAERYVTELMVKEPEACPVHRQILQCPEDGCYHASERTAYDHKAAAYLFDRIMGKPTTRSENVITVRLVEELTVRVVNAFVKVNEIADPIARRSAFAAEIAGIGADFGG